MIVDRDCLVVHRVSGEKVLEYTKPQIGGGVVSGYDPEIKTDRKPLTEGYIGLQAEGQGVEFKNIKIKKLEFLMYFFCQIKKESKKCKDVKLHSELLCRK